MNLCEILHSYNKWILSIISNQSRCISDRVIIYNSFKIFGINCEQDETFKNFISETKRLFENVSFKELNTIPKFHLLLYITLNDNDNTNTLFVKDWLIYLKNNATKNRYDFPYYCWNKDIDTEHTSINYELIESNIEKYCATINLVTDFGTTKTFQFDECDLYFLKSFMLISYQKDYNLLLGNLLLRSLLYLGQKSDSIIISSINYILDIKILTVILDIILKLSFLIPRYLFY